MCNILNMKFTSQSTSTSLAVHIVRTFLLLSSITSFIVPSAYQHDKGKNQKRPFINTVSETSIPILPTRGKTYVRGNSKRPDSEIQIQCSGHLHAYTHIIPGFFYENWPHIQYEYQSSSAPSPGPLQRTGAASG